MYSHEDLYDDDEDYDYNSDDELDQEQTVSSGKNYTVLTTEEIRRRLADDVASVSALLSVPPSSAAILLHRHRWSQEDVHDAWFSDEAKARESVGLVHYNKPPFIKNFKCGICFEKYKYREGAHAGCGHMFCHTCWRSYIGVSIEGGPGCLSLRCPGLSCAAAIDQDFVDRLGSKTDKDRYKDYLFRSYIEDNLKTKWCPAPGCQMAVELGNSGSGGYDVSCLCSYGFCWNCSEEAHRPVNCDTVSKWINKNMSEAENVNWILAFTKPCPKCKRAIEKRDGCMHMTCWAPCNYQFCWICLGPWSEHRTYSCNKYNIEGEEPRRREMAKQSLMRYTHYYERWVANENSRKKASEDLFDMESVNLHRLRLNLDKPVEQLVVVTEAWVQIVECRRVLKWSYAYGYYIPEEEKTKRQFFEYLQGQAELGLERLHHCAENDLKVFLADKPEGDFYTFRFKLKELTSVTRDYFENLVKALENGLSEVGFYGYRAD